MSENAKELREKLMMKERRGASTYSKETLTEAEAYCEGYKTFLDNSRTEREAVAYVKALAKDKGFVEFDPDGSYKPGDRVKLTVFRSGQYLTFSLVLDERPAPDNSDDNTQQEQQMPEGNYDEWYDFFAPFFGNGG